MKSIYFKNSNVVGFEVATANDVIKAQELGLFICNKDEYYFDEYVTELDEDGIETEREATKDERMERIIKALKEGQQLYAKRQNSKRNYPVYVNVYRRTKRQILFGFSVKVSY